MVADCGVAGIIRPFLYSGKFRRSVIDSIRRLKKDIFDDDRVTFLNLDVSKGLFEKKLEFERGLLKELEVCINSELLN